MQKIITFLTLMITSLNLAQEIKTKNITVNSILEGTLFYKDTTSSKTLIILIAGSGPTDRNGNQTGLENNSLKFLAEGITDSDISVFSYDKRIFGLAKQNKLDQANVLFNDFVTDAIDIAAFFTSKKTYTSIYFAGHSEGSLIGMLASQKIGNGFISIAGAGQPINEIITEQITKQAPALKTYVEECFEKLKKGETFKLENPLLVSIFHETLQAYLISWIAYDPREEIKKITVPILLINGTQDIQISESNASSLHTANPKSKLVIIKNMNHVLKIIDKPENNFASYSNPNLPVAEELIQKIREFVKQM